MSALGRAGDARPVDAALNSRLGLDEAKAAVHSMLAFVDAAARAFELEGFDSAIVTVARSLFGRPSALPLSFRSLLDLFDAKAADAKAPPPSSALQKLRRFVDFAASADREVVADGEGAEVLTIHQVLPSPSLLA
jgi:hypothetical protein